MKHLLTNSQLELRDTNGKYVSKHIAPLADRIDREQVMPEKIITHLAKKGWLGSIIDKSYGGAGMDLLTFGLLSEEIGKACTSTRSLLTVQNMVALVIQRWGTESQRTKWLPPLAKGNILAAFALTEPEYGSDANNIQLEIQAEGNKLVLNGKKKWISFGGLAGLILTFGRMNGKLCAVVVEKDVDGLTARPLTDLHGVRGSMLAELEFVNCRIPAANMIGGEGFGLNPVGFSALDLGRYSIAWGCVGMAEACLESAIQYCQSRKQFGKKIFDHQLVKRLISDMTVEIEASRMLCYKAFLLKEKNDLDANKAMMIAKYHASNMAVSVSGKALELFGAIGHSRKFPVERFNRDAKIMTTIEGSNQMMQLMIANYHNK